MNELAAEEQKTVARARSFAKQVAAPNAAAWEAERQLPRTILKAAAEKGLTGLLVPEHLGGKAHSATALAQILEALASVDLALAFSLVVHNNHMGAIARFGSPALQERYLPELMTVERLGAFLLTEPEGGSDAAAIRTRAENTANGWRISGRKAWVTNGTEADLLSVYAQTDPAAGWRGIAAFLVEADTPGVIREDAYDLVGGHALGACGFRFEDCLVPAENLLVPPGEGFKAAMAGIDLARAGVAAMCTGMLAASLAIAVDYLANRDAFGARLSTRQGLQWQLADVATDLEAMRLLTYAATAALDAERFAAIAAAHAKKFATRAALSGVSTCMQALGANGLKQEYPLARHLAGAKIAQYLDGTTEIQNIVISRDLFG
ncbi:MAG: acyl-CoA dehydrogenase family protein [Pseudomonadota bacterium]